MQKKKWGSLLAGSAVLCAFLSFDEPEPAAPLSPEAEIASFPKDYFQSPVSNDLRLTGTFGELRPDHFHAGIDIKSVNGRVGQPILAAADGFVSRIKVQASGYGNVLYVKHPNGYTTLYAHLDRFAPEIEKYVRENQYVQETFEIELKPEDNRFPVKKGQEIGKLGNSGGSSGPHLHFEIRNSTTDKMLNPQLFNLPIADKVPPEIRDMKVYFLTDNREVLTSKPLSLERDKKGVIGLEGDTVRFGALRVGFGVKTYDRMNGMNNDNGVYAIELFADDKLAYDWRMTELDNEETRYHNAHIDYPARKRYGAWFHRCFVLPGNFLHNYVHTENLGGIPLDTEKPVKIRLKVTDAGGNATTLNFWALRADTIETVQVMPFQYAFDYQKENSIALDNFNLHLPLGALYESLRFQYATSPCDETDQYSPLHHLQDTRTPLHKFIDIGLKPDNLPENLHNKAVVAACNEGRPDNCGGVWVNGMLKTQVRNFGNYCIMADTDPPKIVPVSFADDMRKKSAIAFRIRDNFAISGKARGLRFRGTIDGKWVLFEFDQKRERLTYTFDDHVPPGKHTLHLTVTDDRDNEAFFEGNFLK
ncbi:MAG: M23 family metallopeptidase [Saprospiraceae bacterium]|nr:M23 family metallopeptidase [Saprospiraceae bacterium]